MGPYHRGNQSRLARKQPFGRQRLDVLARRRESLAIFDFTLDNLDMQTIMALNLNRSQFPEWKRGRRREIRKPKASEGRNVRRHESMCLPICVNSPPLGSLRCVVPIDANMHTVCGSNIQNRNRISGRFPRATRLPLA